MPATRELVTVSTKRQVQGCGGPEGEQAEEGPRGAEAAEQEQGVGKGSLPQCVCLVFARIFSFLSQAVSRGIGFPDHTDQIGQDVGFYLRRKRFPANPLGVLSVTCLPGPGGAAGPDLVAEQPHGQ